MRFKTGIYKHEVPEKRVKDKCKRNVREHNFCAFLFISYFIYKCLVQFCEVFFFSNSFLLYSGMLERYNSHQFICEDELLITIPSNGYIFNCFGTGFFLVWLTFFHFWMNFLNNYFLPLILIQIHIFYHIFVTFNQICCF